MALNFPSNPTVDQVYAYGLREWKWNGTVWQSVNPSTGPIGPTGPTGSLGPTGPTGSMTLAVNTQTGTSYTLAITDIDRLITLNNAGGVTLTVPTNATASFPVGATINFVQLSAQVTVVGDTGVSILAASTFTKLRTTYSAGSLIKLSTDTWLLVGDLQT